MATSKALLPLFAPFKWAIAFTFALLSIENIIMVLTPLMVGLAIDGLLGGQLQPALWLAGMLLAGTVIGTGRRLYDTRCYGRIYKTLACENAAQGWQAAQPVSALSARTEQLHEMVSFVETELVQCFNAVIKIVGALIMLGIADLRLLGGASAAAIAIALIYSLSGPRIYRLNRGLNDQHDQQVKHLSDKDPNCAEAHFSGIVGWTIRLSDLEARNFALVDVLIIALVVFALWVTATTGNPTPGSVFAILAYVLEFIEGTYLLPLAFQQFVRLREIASRLSLPLPTQEQTS